MGWTMAALKRTARAGLALMDPQEYYRLHPQLLQGPLPFAIGAAQPRHQLAVTPTPSTSTSASSSPESFPAYLNLAAADTDNKNRMNDHRIYDPFILLSGSVESRASS